jgi:hypothetical protein
MHQILAFLGGQIVDVCLEFPGSVFDPGVLDVAVDTAVDGGQELA